MTDTESQSPGGADRVVCPASRDPMVRRLIIAAMLLGFGIWCLTDQREPPEAWNLENINAVAGYVINNFGPYVFLPCGLAVLLWALWAARRKLIADDEGIGYSGAEKIAWEKIDQLDATLLKAKGIIYLRHGGKAMKLDSYYLRNFRELLAFMERRIPQDRQVLE
jgi:hypothetical protein